MMHLVAYKIKKLRQYDVKYLSIRNNYEQGLIPRYIKPEYDRITKKQNKKTLNGRLKIIYSESKFALNAVTSQVATVLILFFLSSFGINVLISKLAQHLWKDENQQLISYTGPT